METIIAFCDTGSVFQVPLALNTHKDFTHQKENTNKQTNKQTQIAPGYESDQVLNMMRLPFPSSRRFSSFCVHEQNCYMYNVYLICYGQRIIKFSLSISAIITM